MMMEKKKDWLTIFSFIINEGKLYPLVLIEVLEMV